jgi:Domain of unknown function (DUF4034)
VPAVKVADENRDMLDDKPVTQKKSASLGGFLGGFGAAVAVAAMAFIVWQRVSPASTSTSGAHPASSFAAQVADETAQFGVKPHTVVLTTDKAMQVTQAIRRGDYAAATTLTNDVLAHSTLQSWGFRPFNLLMGGLSLGSDPALLKNLTAWVESDPQSALAHLMRAKCYEQTAWAMRGEDFSSTISDDHMQAFRDYLHKADEDVRKSIALNPNIPWSYWLWLNVVSGNANTREMEDAFQASIERFPDYYELYRQRLYSLTPKWGGSVGAMDQFVNQYAGNAPEGSPLKLLYLQLSAYLLDAAWVECRSLTHDALTGCIGAYLNRHVSTSVTDGVTKAVDIYKSSDPIQYSNALWPILRKMVDTPGDSTMLNALLQVVADAMGSDNQLIHEPGHNNYVLDDITAQVWAKLGNSANVDQKFKEALSDAERTPFPNEEEKDIAIAGIYDDMTQVARNASQYVKIIAYHDAANAIGGINHGGKQYFKCFAYFKLNHFQDAVDECTHVLDIYGDSLTAHYYRARANEGLRNWDAALAEFGPIADGENNYIRVGAAIDMGHINALRGNYAGELAILDKYTYLFDAALQPPTDLAVSYNNRCFAYMKLGRLQKALEDCTTSLKYGRLPDALQKQQELVKMLKSSPTI